MFLHRKKELEAEEAKLSATLAEHEETLSQIRMRLANPPTSVLPSDQAKAALYLSWKRALAEREELLRQARRRKHELLRDLKARFETQVVLLELERRSAVDGLKEAVAAEKAKVETYKAELVSVESSIESARAAMKRFRDEFESLRVGLLMDRMAKSQQVANLSERRSRLEREVAQFQEAVEAARQKVAAEESAKGEAKLAEERERGERRIAEEQKLIAAKIEQVRNALAERYEAGFRPLLRETEARHVEELQRVVALQRELEAKEAELRAAHETARGLSAAVTVASEGGAAVRDPTTSEVVPEWKLREFEDLKAAVAGLWEQLDVPAEDITAFLSEADLMAPYSPQGAWR
jgi:chromosome segregation ATPase